MTGDSKSNPRFTRKSAWVPERAKRARKASPDWGPVVTKQEFKAECDVNNILRKFKDTGVIEHVNKLQGSFGDFTNAMDYQSSINKVKEAQASFMALPAQVRKKFKNNPAGLVEFVQDPKNRRQAAAMGLLSKEATHKVASQIKAERQAAQDVKDKEIAKLKAQLAAK